MNAKRVQNAILFASMILISVMMSCKKDKIEDPEIEIIEEPKLDERIAAVIPHIRINIEGNEWVTSKEDYLKAVIEIDGNEKFADLAPTTTNIKGRGNSTWNKPKKPFRLKLDSEASILGLPKAKNWILLANYQDYTLMTNAVAMKIGQQLGLPYTNQIIAVDLTINGIYQGNYNLTQQIEIHANRVNVGKDGVLLELDSYFDEEFKFTSKAYNLPVMVKDPDVKSDMQFNAIKNSFESFENLLSLPTFPNTGYGEVFDKGQLVNFLIINNLTGNFEIAHPKSLYMHKSKDGKYTMGPIWDFDWGFGVDELTRKYFNYTDQPLLKANDNRNGAVFLSAFLADPEIRFIYKQQWKKFRANQFDQLLLYIEKYAAEIRESQKKDYALWKVGDNNFPQHKADLKTYLRKRAKYIDAYVASL